MTRTHHIDEQPRRETAPQRQPGASTERSGVGLREHRAQRPADDQGSYRDASHASSVTSAVSLWS